MIREHDVELGRGRTVRLAETGEGPPAVVIHGALQTGADWMLGPIAPLARRFRALVPDRPGHGLSTRRRGEGAPLAQAEALREAVRRRGAERPVLVGHSFGGMVALAWAAAWPQEVAGLVLVAPIVVPELRIEQAFWGPRATPFAGEAIARAARFGLDPALVPFAQALNFSPQPIPEAWRLGFPHDQVATEQAGIANGEDAAAVLPGSPAAVIDFARITAPTYAIHGTADKVVDPARHARRLPDLVRGARAEALEGAGHMVHWFDPERVALAAGATLAAAS